MEGILRFKMGWAYLKNSLKHYENNLKWLKTAGTNSSIPVGLLSEGNLRLKFGGLIFGRAYFWRGFLSELQEAYLYFERKCSRAFKHMSELHIYQPIVNTVISRAEIFFRIACQFSVK